MKTDRGNLILDSSHVSMSFGHLRCNMDCRADYACVSARRIGRLNALTVADCA
jgi:hypothetical protein